MLRALLPAVIGLLASLHGSEVHQHGRFRVHYETSGPHAVLPGDQNQNAVPDQVEDLLLQTRAAYLLWIDTLGFPDPFLSPRYQSASFLDIHLRSKDSLKANGVAYDELQRYRKPGDPPDTLSISFAVATSVRPSLNLTPAHEFFHLIQNGATFFKNRWFTEGTARWSEKGLGLGDLGSALRGSWPPPDAILNQLDSLAYETAPLFWEPLILSLDQPSEIPSNRLPSELAGLRYSDGSPVLKDLKLRGWTVIRALLQELSLADDQAFASRRLARWSEEDQKSPLNTPAILQSVHAASSRFRAP